MIEEPPRTQSMRQAKNNLPERVSWRAFRRPCPRPCPKSSTLVDFCRNDVPSRTYDESILQGPNRFARVQTGAAGSFRTPAAAVRTRPHPGSQWAGGKARIALSVAPPPRPVYRDQHLFKIRLSAL